MKKIIIFSFMISSAILNAQDDKSRQTKKENETKSSETKTGTSAKTTSFVEGEIPSPESQGFLKKVVDGKDVYYKQEGSIYLEYQPK